MRLSPALTVCLLSFCICLPVRAYVIPPPPPLPPVKIAEHIAATQILSANSALVHKEDGSYATIRLTPPYAQQPWTLQWDAAADGWKQEPQDFGPNFAASHDGKTIAFGFNVSTPSADPADEYPLLVTAIVLCDADGGKGRVAALADIVDGGPRLYFLQNDHFLLGPDFLPCAPTPDGLRAWYAAMNDQPSGPLPAPPNALDLRTEKFVSFEALREVPWLTMNPYSDEFYFDEMDTNTVHFGRFVNDEPELISNWAPPEGSGISNMYWAGPGVVLIWSDGKPRMRHPFDIVAEMGIWTAEPPHWIDVYYAQLGNYTLFSRDAGRTVSFGLPMHERHDLPELAHFAMPVDEDGWAERVDTWLPLPDHSGVLINTPGIDGGGLYLVKLSAPAA